eukprot:13448-Heterococcus_DN1.PRE.1
MVYGTISLREEVIKHGSFFTTGALVFTERNKNSKTNKENNINSNNDTCGACGTYPESSGDVKH